MGFTLLEMLVVVVVLGFLMIGLTQGVRSRVVAVGRAVAPGRRNLRARCGRADFAFSAERDRCAGVGWLGAAASPQLQGHQREPHLCRRPADWLGTTRGPILRSSSAATGWSCGGLRIATSSPARRRLNPVKSSLFAKSIASSLAYWGALSPDQAATWQVQWDGASIPSLIRLRVVFAKGDRRRFPDLIAAPQA